MSSGQDIRAGRNTTAESTTALFADTTDDSPPVDFQGDYVLIVGSNERDRQPFGKALNGLFSYGHGRNDGSQSGSGVVGAGGRFAGTGVVGLGAGVDNGFGGTGVVGIGGDGSSNIGGVSIAAGIGVLGQGGVGGPGTGTGPGVYGSATGISDGVIGVTAAPNQSGVAGVNQSGTGAGIGVFGRADRAGVLAQGVSSGAGVLAVSTGGTGVVGLSTVGVGVVGSSAGSVGVVGVAGTNIGVLGNSSSNHGVMGDARGAPMGSAAAGIFGITTNSRAVSGLVVGSKNPSSAVAIYGESGADSTFNSVGRAGLFFGPVLVVGDFTAFGGKSAAVPHPDGSHRTLYSVESPDSWFEDFGNGSLAKGRARVKVDPDFMALVHAHHYHVFLTPHGECNVLYVTGQTEEGFEVIESQGGQSNVAFSYRVVAKRKDILGKRLAVVEKPKKLSESSLIPAPMSRDLLTPELNLSEQQLAQLGAGAAIPLPPKPILPNLGGIPTKE